MNKKRLLVIGGEQEEESLEEYEAGELEPAVHPYEPDVLVTRVEMGRGYEAPVPTPGPFLTGEGEEDLVQEILEALDEHPEESPWVRYAGIRAIPARSPGHVVYMPRPTPRSCSSTSRP